MGEPSYPHLFSTLKLGAIEAPNRVFMAPLTRSRAQADGVHNTEIARTYYEQRSSAGLIISEATEISPMAKGYINVPGIYTEAHVEAWRPVVDGVHEAGGRIFLQLWHVGRISHTSLLPNGAQPLSASDVRAQTQSFTPDGMQDASAPRPIATEEIPSLIEEYRHAAAMADKAGFDGVEIHGANGYLLDQFLHPHTNKRTDEYGGGPDNRARIVIEVVKALVEELGPEKVGLRLSPTGKFGDMNSDGMEESVEGVFQGIGDLGLAYLHVVERVPGADYSDEDAAILDRLHAKWNGVYIANGEFTPELAEEWIAKGRADAVAFGRDFIPNPDLPERIRQGASLNEPDMETYYAGGAEGYITYPSLEG